MASAYEEHVTARLSSVKDPIWMGVDDWVVAKGEEGTDSGGFDIGHGP